MTDFTRYKSRTRDIQDHVERGVYGTWTEIPGAGSMMSVRGTGTVDEEVPILNLGYSFHLPPNSNAEVVMLSLGSDVNDKVCLPTLPRDLQHPWAEGQGGVQHPTDPSRRLEYNDDETWLKDGSYRLGNNREVSVTVKDGTTTISIEGGAVLNVSGTTEVNSTGAVTLNAPTTEINSDLKINGSFEANGGSFRHNGKSVGASHTHGGVDTGQGNTQGPN